MRLKGPKNRGSKKSSSEHISGKRKTWLSEGIKFEGGRDLSPRLGFAWWQSPMYKDARTSKWEKLRRENLHA
jgi:hypothetical protein